jgi:hypothetical protein
MDETNFRRSNVRLFIYTMSLFAVFGTLSCSKQPSDVVLEQVARSYFNHIANGDFEAAATLFHCPENYTQQELLNDKNSIAKALGVVNKEFGNILNMKKINSLENYLYIIISGGNTPYWDKHSYSIPFIYEVAFNNEGQGNVILFLCRINKKWEIQKVEYCLPTIRPDSKIRINEIIQKMIQTVSPGKPRGSDTNGSAIHV